MSKRKSDALMEKILIRYLLVKKEDHDQTGHNVYIGNKEKNQIFYMEEEICVMLSIYQNKIVMKRKTSDYEMNMNFILGKEENGSYTLLSYEKTLELEVWTKSLKIEATSFEIVYQLKIEKELIGEFYFMLEYEVVT